MTIHNHPTVHRTRPPLSVLALGVVMVLMVVSFGITYARLDRVANLASVSITGWTYSEFIRQAADVRVLAARGGSAADLEVPLAILQSKAEIVNGEPLTDRIDARARALLERAVRSARQLTPQELTTPAGRAILDQISDGALAGYSSAVATLGRQRSTIASDLRTAEWTLTILAAVLVFTSVVAVRQLLRGAQQALKVQVARNRESEAARLKLEQAASELRAAERDLQRERDFALQVMGAMGEGLYVTDPAGHFEYVNPTLARTVGADAGALIGQPMADVLHVPSLGEQDGARVTLEHALPLPGGRVMPTQLTLVARGGGGEIGVLTDLTEIKRAEARLRALYDVTSMPDEDLTFTVERLLDVGQEAFAGAPGAYVQWPDAHPVVTASVNVSGGAPNLVDWADTARTSGTAVRQDDVMAVPVSATSGLDGMLVFRRAPDAPAFTHVDEDYLKLIGQWLEQAVERRHAYDLLRRSEERTVAVIRSSLDAIITANEHGVITEFNPAAEQIFGVTRDCALGQSMSTLIVPAGMRGAHTQGMERVRAGGAPRIIGKRLELTALRGSGEEFPVELSVVKLPMDPPVYAGFIRDITERRAAEANLRERTTQLDSVFNVSPDGFVTFDAAGIVVDANPAFLALTGSTLDEVLGLDESGFERLLRRRSEHMRPGSSGTPSSPDILQLARPARRVLKRATRVMETPAGDTLGQVMYFRDITHEAEVSAMKSEFMSTAAHELRTPMTSIYGFTELLLTRTLDPDTTRDLLETIYRQAGRLILLLTELLDLARIEARAGKDFHITEQPLLPLIEGAVEAFTPAGKRPNLILHVPRDLPPLPVDNAKIHQALGNVISNAFKYSPHGGDVVITAWHDPTYQELMHVSVRDHGIGMTTDQAHKAFERFYRADNSGSIPGTGLGLSLVQEIMQCHGGRATLHSEPGQGTTVTLTFPLVPPLTPDASSEGHPSHA